MGKVAIIGIGMSDFSDHIEKNAWDIVADAYNEALADVEKGIDPNDIECIVVSSMLAGLEQQQLAIAPLITNQLGLAGRPTFQVSGPACATATTALRMAEAMVAASEHKTAMVVAVDRQEVHTRRTIYDYSRTGDHRYEGTFGLPMPGHVALMERRYMKEYGAKEEDFALVAVKGHEYAMDHPHAYLHMKVTVDQVMKSPYIITPLKLFELTTIIDGSVVAILASEDVAKRYTDNPVYIIGVGAATTTFTLQDIADLTTVHSCRPASESAFKMAGIEPKRVKVTELYDCFTPLEVFFSEEAGFFKKGEGYIALREGRTRREGDLPVNVSGGNQGRGHPPGGTGLAQTYEIVHQLRGTAAKWNRQVKGNPDIGYIVNIGGGAISTSNVMIFAI